MSCVIMYRVTLTGRIEVVGGGTEFIDRAAAHRHVKDTNMSFAACDWWEIVPLPAKPVSPSR